MLISSTNAVLEIRILHKQMRSYLQISYDWEGPAARWLSVFLRFYSYDARQASRLMLHFAYISKNMKNQYLSAYKHPTFLFKINRKIEAN